VREDGGLVVVERSSLALPLLKLLPLLGVFSSLSLSLLPLSLSLLLLPPAAVALLPRPKLPLPLLLLLLVAEVAAAGVWLIVGDGMCHRGMAARGAVLATRATGSLSFSKNTGGDGSGDSIAKAAAVAPSPPVAASEEPLLVAGGVPVTFTPELATVLLSFPSSMLFALSLAASSARTQAAQPSALLHRCKWTMPPPVPELLSLLPPAELDAL
jgi:hypothetical protein